MHVFFLFVPTQFCNMKKKSSLHAHREAVRNALREHKGRKRVCACLPSVVRRIFSRFLYTTAAALQIAVGGFLPALSFYRSRGTRDPTLWACSFHCQFHDLRLVLQRGDFVGGEAGVFRDGFHGHAVGFHAT